MTTRASRRTSRGIYSKLVDVDQVDFLFSPYGANLTAPVMPFAKQRDRFIVGILTLAANNGIKHDKFFQAAPWGPNGAEDYARGYFDLANAEGIKKMAILAADTEFSKTAAVGGRRVCEQFGMQVVDYQIYPPANRDFTAVLRNIRASNAEAVFVCSYPADSTAIVRGVQEVGVGDQVRLFGGSMVGFAPIVVDQVIATIRKLQELRNLTIMMAEQSVFQAIEVASRAYILSQGKIIREFDRSESVSTSEIRSAMMGVG